MLIGIHRSALGDTYLDDNGVLMETLPDRLDFQDFAGVKPYTIVAGDTLYKLASQWYPASDEGETEGSGTGARLWWVIGMFQLPPILDPTLELVAGDQLVRPPRSVAEAARDGMPDMQLSALT
jgi:hypothetical protein